MTAHQAVKQEYPDAATLAGKLYSIEPGPTSVTVAKIVRVLFPDVTNILDLTWGDGAFWDRSVLNTLPVFGNDLNTEKSCHYHQDFTDTAFRSESFDLVAFDPPYQTDVGKDKGSRMSDKYGHYPTIDDLRLAVYKGVHQAWRIARVGILVKVQDYIHGGKYVEMTEWVRGAIDPPPYQVVHQVRAGKQEDPKWGDDDGQLSAYAISSTYLVFRKGSQTHKRRGQPKTVAPSPVLAPSAPPAKTNGRIMAKPERIMGVPVNE